MATTAPASLTDLVDRIYEIAKSIDDGYGSCRSLILTRDEAALLLEQFEPKRAPEFEGWADIDLMGHRNRVAYVREIELAHRGFLELTWIEPGSEIKRREIYATSAVFSLIPLEDEAAALELLDSRTRPF
jgi:hypothetical protein